MPEQDSDERQARSIALEKAYVHDVYDYIAPHFSSRKFHVWPRIKQFLYDLEPGSLVADVGCGQGNYLGINNETFKIGMDRCQPLLEVATEKRHEVVHCDNLQLPFRDESLDAALSVAVVHHFATTERRIEAIRELARILRIGGRVMITVWAMEQRHRRFESQDVLVPWHQPAKSSSEDRGSSAEREVNSTTSDDDIMVYQAYSHMSDSDGAQKRHKFRRGRSFDTSSPSSSELSSPNETCYSFVRRALKKLSASTSPYNYSSRSRPYFYSSCRRPWFSECSAPTRERKESVESESADDQPIELRHLDKNENVSFPLPKTEKEEKENVGQKSLRSLGDLLGLIPNLLRSKPQCIDKKTLQEIHKRISTVSDPREYVRKSMGIKNGIVRSKSTVSCISRLTEIRCTEEEDTAEKSTKPKQAPAFEMKGLKEETYSVVKNDMAEIQPSSKKTDVGVNEDVSHISSHYSMPELYQLPAETQPQQQQSTLMLPIAECYKGTTNEMYEPGVFYHKDEISLPVRNGFVKRSISVDTGDMKGVRSEMQPRRFSASATQGLLGSLRACIIPKSPSRGSSLKSDTSVDSEESIVSVIPRNCNSIQSDTSVDSEDSIVSIIHQNSVELDSFTWDLRKEALTRSAQTSPLTVHLDRLSYFPLKEDDHMVCDVSGNDTSAGMEFQPKSEREAPQEHLPNINSTETQDSIAKNNTLMDPEIVLHRDILDVKEKGLSQNVPEHLYSTDELLPEDTSKLSEEAASTQETADDMKTTTNRCKLQDKDCLASRKTEDVPNDERQDNSFQNDTPSSSEEKSKHRKTTCAFSQTLTNSSMDILDPQTADSGCTSTVDMENEINDVSAVRPVAHSFDSGCSNSLPFDDEGTEVERMEELFEQKVEPLNEEKNGDAACTNEETVLPQGESVDEEDDEADDVKSHNTSLSLSTSQESLNDNDTGGSVTFHRYYHVFREGELDSLIEKYVENLHIISSFYDHANWCVVAEKVQVWTI